MASDQGRLPARPAARLAWLERLVAAGSRLPAPELAALEAWEDAHPGCPTSSWPGWNRHVPTKEVA